MRNGSNGLINNLKADAIRYFKNSLQRIGQAPRENGAYADVKLVREGAGTMYLGVLMALDAFALTRGYTKDTLPQGIGEYRELLRKHSVHNGKLKDAFDDVYAYLHILAYYRSERDARIIKKATDKARFAIERITGKRIG